MAVPGSRLHAVLSVPGSRVGASVRRDCGACASVGVNLRPFNESASQSCWLCSQPLLDEFSLRDAPFADPRARLLQAGGDLEEEAPAWSRDTAVLACGHRFHRACLADSFLNWPDRLAAGGERKCPLRIDGCRTMSEQDCADILADIASGMSLRLRTPLAPAELQRLQALPHEWARATRENDTPDQAQAHAEWEHQVAQARAQVQARHDSVEAARAQLQAEAEGAEVARKVSVQQARAASETYAKTPWNLESKFLQEQLGKLETAQNLELSKQSRELAVSLRELSSQKAALEAAAAAAVDRRRALTVPSKAARRQMRMREQEAFERSTAQLTEARRKLAKFAKAAAEYQTAKDETDAVIEVAAQQLDDAEATLIATSELLQAREAEFERANGELGEARARLAQTKEREAAQAREARELAEFEATERKLQEEIKELEARGARAREAALAAQEADQAPPSPPSPPSLPLSAEQTAGALNRARETEQRAMLEKTAMPTNASVFERKVAKAILEEAFGGPSSIGWAWAVAALKLAVAEVGESKKDAVWKQHVQAEFATEFAPRPAFAMRMETVSRDDQTVVVDHRGQHRLAFAPGAKRGDDVSVMLQGFEVIAATTAKGAHALGVSRDPSWMLDDQALLLSVYGTFGITLNFTDAKWGVKNDTLTVHGLHKASELVNDHYDKVYLHSPLGAVLGAYRSPGPEKLIEKRNGKSKWKDATRFSLVTQLLSQNADPNWRPANTFNTPLHQALAFLAYQNYEGSTTGPVGLADASRKEKAAIVQLLCSKGASTTALRDSMTPWQLLEQDQGLRASIPEAIFTTLNKLYQPYRPKASGLLEGIFQRLDVLHDSFYRGEPLEVFVARRADSEYRWVDASFPSDQTTTDLLEVGSGTEWRTSSASWERQQTLGRLITNTIEIPYHEQNCLVDFQGHVARHRVNGQPQTFSVLLRTLHALARAAPDCDRQVLSKWVFNELWVLLAGPRGCTDARALAPFGRDESLRLVHTVAEIAYVMGGEFGWCASPWDSMDPALNKRPALPPNVTLVGTLLCRLQTGHVPSALLALRIGFLPLDLKLFEWRPSGTLCETPLMTSCLGMRHFVAAHLLDRGADPWAEHGELPLQPARPYDAAVAAEAACTELAYEQTTEATIAALDAWTGVVAIMNATPKGGSVRSEIVLKGVPTEQKRYDEIQRSVLADLFRIFEPHLFDDQALEPLINLLAARWEAYAKRIYAAKTKEIASELGKTLNEEALEVVAVLDETEGAILPAGWSRIAALLGIRSGT